MRSAKVAGLMKQEDVGSVPVVESAGSRRLVGIVTDRDIVVKVVAAGRGAEQATGQGRDDAQSGELPGGRRCRSGAEADGGAAGAADADRGCGRAG